MLVRSLRIAARPILRVVVGRSEGVEPVRDCVEAGTDAVLFCLEQVDGDRVGVVSLEEFDLFGFEFGFLSGEQVPLVAGRCGRSCLRQGDTIVQRGTRHALQNRSEHPVTVVTTMLPAVGA